MMITVSTLLTFLGFEFFYQTSKKALLNRPKQLGDWFGANGKLAKVIGTVLLVMACALSVSTIGVGAGVFAFIYILMMVGSLVVLISPIWKLSIFWLIGGFGLMFLLELL